MRVRLRNEKKIKIYSWLAPGRKAKKKREKEAGANYSIGENVKRRGIKRRRTGTGTAGAGKTGVVLPGRANIGKLLARVIVPAGIAAVNIAPDTILAMEAVGLRRAGKRPVAGGKPAHIAG